MTTQPATAEVTKLESMERAQRRNLIIQYILMVLLVFVCFNLLRGEDTLEIQVTVAQRPVQ